MTRLNPKGLVFALCVVISWALLIGSYEILTIVVEDVVAAVE